MTAGGCLDDTSAGGEKGKKPLDRPLEKPLDKTLNTPVNTTLGTPLDKPVDKVLDNASDKAFDEATVRVGIGPRGDTEGGAHHPQQGEGAIVGHYTEYMVASLAQHRGFRFSRFACAPRAGEQGLGGEGAEGGEGVERVRTRLATVLEL